MVPFGEWPRRPYGSGCWNAQEEGEILQADSLCQVRSTPSPEVGYHLPGSAHWTREARRKGNSCGARRLVCMPLVRVIMPTPAGRAKVDRCVGHFIELFLAHPR